MVNVIEVRPDLGAEPAAGNRMGRITAKPDRPAVFDFRNDGTGIRAIVRTNTTNEECSHVQRLNRNGQRALLPETTSS
jgi:hypothetical protein